LGCNQCFGSAHIICGSGSNSGSKSRPKMENKNFKCEIKYIFSSNIYTNVIVYIKNAFIHKVNFFKKDFLSFGSVFSLFLLILHLDPDSIRIRIRNAGCNSESVYELTHLNKLPVVEKSDYMCIANEFLLLFYSNY
jgi:hypothetical protein